MYERRIKKRDQTSAHRDIQIKSLKCAVNISKTEIVADEKDQMGMHFKMSRKLMEIP